MASELEPELPVFDFSDPEFVRVWLQSLYLLSPELQLQIVDSLLGTVHRSPVQKVLEEYAVGLTGGLPLSSEEPAQQQYSHPLFGSLAALWRRSPAFTVAGIAGLALLALRGIAYLVGLVP